MTGKPGRGAAPRGAPSNEIELQRALAVAEQARADLEALAEQRNMIGQAMRELLVCKSALTALRDAAEGEEVLVPLGAGHFAHARLTDPGRVVMGLGSDVSVESEIVPALSRVEAEIAVARTNDERLRTEQERLTSEFQAIAERVQGLAPSE